MRPFLLFALLTSCVYADLTCLKWGVGSLAAGLLCRFNHKKFKAIETKVEKAAVVAEETAVRDVENVVASLKDAGGFLLTHHPAVLAYDFAKTAKNQGLNQATNQLEGQGKEILKVDVGVIKEAGNIAVGTADLAVHTLSIVALKHWRDAALCTIKQAQAETQPIATDNTNLTRDCITEAFQALDKPTTFTLSNPNQKIGGTLAQVASLFVPVGDAENGARIAAREGFNLAIPGTEDAGRIYKQIAGGKAEKFASEHEAMAVQGKLDDEAWTGANCVPSAGPLEVSTSIVRRKRRLTRRGDTPAGLVCNLPEGPAADAETIQTEQPDDTNWDADDSALYSEAPTRVIKERELVPPPPLRLWGDAAVDKAGILADLEETMLTATLAWEPDVVAAFPPVPPRVSASQELFALLRDAFEGDSEELGDFRSDLWIRNDVDAPGRRESSSTRWIDTTDGDINLQKMQVFTKAATAQALKIAKELKGISNEDVANTLDSDIDFFYQPSGPGGLATLDKRGEHVDAGVLQLGAADQPGLVFSESVPHGNDKFRAPVLRDGWNIIPCSEFNGEASWTAGALHTVFGPEIVHNGRVSMIVNVRVKFRKEKAWAAAVRRASARV